MLAPQNSLVATRHSWRNRALGPGNVHTITNGCNNFLEFRRPCANKPNNPCRCIGKWFLPPHRASRRTPTPGRARRLEIPSTKSESAPSASLRRMSARPICPCRRPRRPSAPYRRKRKEHPFSVPSRRRNRRPDPKER